MSISRSQPRNFFQSDLARSPGALVEDLADFGRFSIVSERQSEAASRSASLGDGYWSLAAPSMPANSLEPALASQVLANADAVAAASATFGLDPSPSIAAAFAAGNFVVFRVGTGAAALNGNATAAFLDEYTAAGTLVQTIALPTVDGVAGNQTFTVSGSATTEGYMTLSADGRYLVMAGYDAAVGTVGVAGTTSAAVNRVIARVAADGTIDTTTALNNAFSTGNPRSVASTDGSTFWLAGSNTGVLTAAFGATSATTVSTTFANLREIAIYDGQLYVSSQSGALRLGTVGAGTPTSSGQTITSLPGFATATNLTNAYFFADLTASVAGVDTLYVADDRSIASGGGLQKWSLVGGSWVLNGTAATNLTAGLRGVAGSVSGGNVSFYATDASALTKVVSLIDTSGYNAAFSSSSFTTVLTAGNNMAIRSIAFAPQAAGGNPGALDIADASVTEGTVGPAPMISFTVTRSGGTTGAISATWTVAFTGSADASDLLPMEPLTGTVSFANGETQKTITIQVQPDNMIEPDETFTVTLSAPTGGATLNDATAIGTIIDDDAPRVSINDVSIAEGDSGTTLITFTVTRTGGAGAFDVGWSTNEGTATNLVDYLGASGTLSFGIGENTKTIQVAIVGDTTSEPNETFEVLLFNATNGAVITDGTGVGTINNDDFTFTFIHDIQGTAYWSPILAGDGITAYNTMSTTTVTIRAVVTALDGVGSRQGFYITEENADWDASPFSSEGIFVMTRNDSSVGQLLSIAAPGLAVGDVVTLTAQVMEYQVFQNMPRTVLVNATGITVQSSGNPLPTITITSAPNSIMTAVTPDYTDSSDGAGDTFDASNYALSFWETVEGMLVTIPNMVVADGFVSSSGGRPFLQAYSTNLADANQINSRGGYTIAGDPPNSPPNTANTDDGTLWGGRTVHDGDINPDIIEVDFTDFAVAPPAGLSTGASMGDQLGDLTGIIDFDFTDRKLFVTNVGGTGFVDNGTPAQEVTSFGNDSRSLTVATFNVENLDPNDGGQRFTDLANAIANNLKSPDIICIEEIQDNNGAAGGDGTSGTGTNAATTWQNLVNALNAATGKVYQWVDELPVYNAEGGEQSGNIRVGFLYDTGRVQLGNLAANATIAERRQYTDRIGDGVRTGGDLIAYDDSMLGGEINTADWTTTRKSLLGEFNFNGNTVYVTANHWPSKGGSGSFWQLNQDVANGNPANSDWAQRNAIGQDVYAMLNHIQTNAANANIVAGGDFNEFYFNRPMEVVTGYVTTDGNARVGGSRFDNLMVTELPEAERYSYVFDGRSQGIDFILANARMSAVADYDVVHINTGYNAGGVDPSLSDHDPSVASFDFRTYAETLTGTAGADTINGMGGNDTLRGGAGNDLLIGGAGADQMEGGADNDFYFVDQAGDVVIELAGEGTDQVFAGVSWTLTAGSHVENLSTTDHAGTDAVNLTGNELSQTIYGNAGDNILDGNGGGDVLLGRNGNDWYFIRNAADLVYDDAGEGAADRVFASVSWSLNAGAQIELISTTNHGSNEAIDLKGNEFAQLLFGNEGANRLDGGYGSDTIRGGGGADLFAFTTVMGSDNADLIVDFEFGIDKLGFAGISQAALAAGAFRVGSQAEDADDRIIYNQTTGILYYDGDGNGAGAAVQFASIGAGLNLSANDFVTI